MTSRRAGEAVLTESFRYRARMAGLVIAGTRFFRCRLSVGRGGREAGDLPGQPARLVLELAQGDLEVGELPLQGVLTGLQPDVPVGDLVAEVLDLRVAALDGQ